MGALDVLGTILRGCDLRPFVDLPAGMGEPDTHAGVYTGFCMAFHCLVCVDFFCDLFLSHFLAALPPLFMAEPMLLPLPPFAKVLLYDSPALLLDSLALAPISFGATTIMRSLVGEVSL
jgi:hypothetical protein